jgi:hypothetical protein
MKKVDIMFIKITLSDHAGGRTSVGAYGIRPGWRIHAPNEVGDCLAHKCAEGGRILNTPLRR